MKLQHLTSQQEDLIERIQDVIERKRQVQEGETDVEVEWTSRQEFQKWYLQLKSSGNEIDNSVKEKQLLQPENEPLEKYISYRKHCQEVVDNSASALNLLEEMLKQHSYVNTTTTELHDTCETLLTELDELKTRLRLIETPMPYFIDLQSIAPKLGFRVSITRDFIQIEKATGRNFGRIDPTSPEFDVLLARIDECISFLMTHMNYRDSQLFIDGYRSLMTNALQLGTDYAIKMIKNAKDSVLQVLSETNGGDLSNMSELDETTPPYRLFHPLEPILQAITRQLSHRSSHDAYAELLSSIYEAYAHQRIYIIMPYVTVHFQTTTQLDLVSLLRFGCNYIIQLCQMEYQLMTQLLVSCAEFESIVFQLGGELYKAVRYQMIVQTDLEMLCETIQILQNEIIQDQIRPRGVSVEAFEPVIDRMIEDAQERLIYCAQVFIRDRIEGFEPTPQDLNYPERLLNPTSVYSTWYPAVEHTLMCLSKIYRYVDVRIFEELASDALQTCTLMLKRGAAEITSEIDAKLFLIKNLLTLREQITPFDIGFAIQEVSLDFSVTTEALNHLISADFSPFIHRTETNAKKDLERQLKVCCTEFIDHVVKMLLEKSTDFESMRLELSAVEEKLNLYLGNTDTVGILFKPVKRKLLESLPEDSDARTAIL